jgi:hypothetical protein
VGGTTGELGESAPALLGMLGAKSHLANRHGEPGQRDGIADASTEHANPDPERGAYVGHPERGAYAGHPDADADRYVPLVPAVLLV